MVCNSYDAEVATTAYPIAITTGDPYGTRTRVFAVRERQIGPIGVSHCPSMSRSSAGFLR
jgi:hypothetical protein